MIAMPHSDIYGMPKQMVGPEVLKCFSGESYGGEVNLTCPTCSSNYSHISEVFTRLGSDQYEAGIYKGTHAQQVTMERRSALVICISGECGHYWRLVIQQHKGINTVSIEFDDKIRHSDLE